MATLTYDYTAFPPAFAWTQEHWEIPLDNGDLIRGTLFYNYSIVDGVVCDVELIGMRVSGVTLHRDMIVAMTGLGYVDNLELFEKSEIEQGLL